jgi:phosphoribosylaminoimidazolecarboxamide formyltransferase/IMP cyclohydrolase
MRVLVSAERRHSSPGERDYRRVLGGLLVQDRDADLDDRSAMTIACGEPTEDEWGELLFAWRVCKHASSNAIVLSRGLQTIGIGAGQMSRVDAVRLAIVKARELGRGIAGRSARIGRVLPSPTDPGLALEAGVNLIVQPGGSKRDAEVVEAVRSAGSTMVLTGKRHFRH